MRRECESNSWSAGAVANAFVCVWALACSGPEPTPAPVIELRGLDGGFEKVPVRREGTGAISVPVEVASEAKGAAGQSSSLEAGEPLPRVAEESEPAVAQPRTEPSAPLDDGTPKLAATTIAATVYRKPHTIATRIGYVRLGGIVQREATPITGTGCKGDWYRVYPTGYMCTDDATTRMDDPLVLASAVRPDLSKPLPYHYGFVRATAPQYLRIPTYEEQKKSEFKLDDHLDWYGEHYLEVQRVALGANDVALDERGFPRLGVESKGAVLSTQLSTTELLGGHGDFGEVPFWLRAGRAIPNVSGFEVPEYAIFADRVRRKTGLSFVDAFVAQDDDFRRRFGVTVDLRLIPATKVKPDSGSPFHGVELTPDFPLPVAIVSNRGSKTWKLIQGRDEAAEAEALPWRVLVPLTGRARIKAGRRFYQLSREPQRWVQASDVGVISTPPNYPEPAEKGHKWIDISLVQQTLVLFEGKRPVYATLVSTGRDRLGDPKTSLATPQGEFRIQSKHIAAAMDSEENSSVSGGTKARAPSLSPEARATKERLVKAEADGKKLDIEDQRRLENIKKGRHPEYGVTLRRGFSDYELRDVPWIQYFAAGYALHGAYWHDVFGTPRSHGCVNLSPIDARVVFMWTNPAVPESWHGVNTGEDTGEGTFVRVRE